MGNIFIEALWVYMQGPELLTAIRWIMFEGFQQRNHVTSCFQDQLLAIRVCFTCALLFWVIGKFSNLVNAAMGMTGEFNLYLEAVRGD